MAEIFRKTWAVAWKNLQVLSKDRGELAIMFLLPLLFASLLAMSASPPTDEEVSSFQLDVYLVNDDEGPYGDMVVSALDEVPVLDVLEIESAGAADKLVGEGQKLAAIIIPPDFSNQIDAYDPTSVEVIVDPLQPQWAGQVSGLVNFAVAPPSVYGEVQHAIRTLIADSGLLEGAEPSVVQAVEAQMVGAIMTQIQQMQSDPLITVEIPAEGEEEAAEEPFNAFAYTIPGFAVMFAFFLMGTMAQTVHAERDHGTFRRIMAAPMDRGVFVGGTMLAFMIIVFLQIVFLFGIAAAAFGMPIGNSIPGLVVVTFFLSLTSTSLGLLLASVTRNGRQAGAIGLVLGFVLAGLGGTLIQFRIYESGGFLQLVGMLSPHAHAVEAFDRLILDGLGFVDILLPALILLGFAAAYFLAAVLLLKFD